MARELHAGEVIRWQARPDEFALARREWGSVVGGLYFVLFSTFMMIEIMGGGWHSAKRQSGTDWPAILFNLLFFGIGGWLVLAPWREWRRAARTLYVVTTRQALIIELCASTKVTRYNRSSLRCTIRTERADGSGNLVLERYATRGARGSTRMHEVGFFGISDVAAVDRMVREIVEQPA